ncbi:MAG: Fur family transcriptional regulator [Chloroflexota bacterium]
MDIISDKAAKKQAVAPLKVRQMLGTSGLRFTRQRALILDIIRRGGGHQDADEVYRRARQKDPRLSLSTVYRSLQMFKRLGLVEELHFDDSHHHYEVKPASEHHHLVCLGCGKVVEFSYPVSRYVRKNVAEARDFEITSSEVHLTGYCPECRRKRGTA